MVVFYPHRPYLHCTTPALAGGARERSAAQVSGILSKYDNEVGKGYHPLALNKI